MSTTYVKLSCIGCGTQTHTTMEKTLESLDIGEAPRTIYQMQIPNHWTRTIEGKYNCPDCTTYLAQKENQLS